MFVGSYLLISLEHKSPEVLHDNFKIFIHCILIKTKKPNYIVGCQYILIGIFKSGTKSIQDTTEQ